MPYQQSNPIPEVIEKDIFKRLLNGETIFPNDPQIRRLKKESYKKTKELLNLLNNSSEPSKIQETFSHILDKKIENVTVFTPIYINYGNGINGGKNVFINFGCTFFALGGITIEADILIGPKVSLITENHLLNPAERKGLIGKSICIKKNVWIGANATILHCSQ